MQQECKKFIDFIITQRCTYKCPYCSQSKEQSIKCNDAEPKTIKSFYKLLKKINKDFEITITGGEAILHPDFFEIIQKIKKIGFKINLITNLSFKLEKYIEIFNLLDENLNQFDISFHLNQIKNFDETLEKLELFLTNKPKNTKTVFYIPLYKIDKENENRIEKLLQIAKKYNIEHSFQKIRYIDKYSEETSKKYISKHSENKTFANLCYAGNQSLVIYENGNAYRCYSSRFTITNYLGNINNKNFKLSDKPKACCQKCCTCPKPKAYNQITQKRNFLNAYIQKTINTICLPYCVLKNINIIKIKLKQKLKQQNRFF